MSDDAIDTLMAEHPRSRRRWCEECGCTTNHTTADHLAADEEDSNE